MLRLLYIVIITHTHIHSRHTYLYFGSILLIQSCLAPLGGSEIGFDNGFGKLCEKRKGIWRCLALHRISTNDAALPLDQSEANLFSWLYGFAPLRQEHVDARLFVAVAVT
jgi:hypothetical protein